MNTPGNLHSRNLVLNAIVLNVDWDSVVRVWHRDYVNAETLRELRRRLGSDFAVRRFGNKVEVSPATADSVVEGEPTLRKFSEIPSLLAQRVEDWLVEYVSSTGAEVFRARDGITVVSRLNEDNILASTLGNNLPSIAGLALQTTFEVQVRVVRPKGKPEIYVAIGSRSRLRIDVPAEELMALGVPIVGLYVQRQVLTDDHRKVGFWRLTGKVESIDGAELVLTDYDDGWPRIQSSHARLEPRMEVLAHVLSHLSPNVGSKNEVLRKLRTEIGKRSSGKALFDRTSRFAAYLGRGNPILLDGHTGNFEEFVSTKGAFPEYQVFSRPNLIFDARSRQTDVWNQRGLDNYGPYDRYEFNPKRLNIAVICYQSYQGRVEEFIGQLLEGMEHVAAGRIGFLRRFGLEKPFVKIFTTRHKSSEEYLQAARSAVEYITDIGKSWNLALVQTEEYMEDLLGDSDPYPVVKAFCLTKDIAVQYVHFETICQPETQRAYSLNNIGLACYAKLGGIPWLLPADQKVAHELVIGLGSHQERNSRFGHGDRYVGFTTVFSGDGRYLLGSRTRSVPFEQYATALLDAVRAAVDRVRSDFAWAHNDPVRLIFHAFKPVKDVEVSAVRALMAELDLPHAEYAFLHVSDSHPFRVFDTAESGVRAGYAGNKGTYSPPRGLFVSLSSAEALVCLKGARELKQVHDGHPEPVLIHLHRDSTFRDLTYLGQQVFSFSCHSWRSFSPAPMPITILYSQLVAANLASLKSVPSWTEDGIVGRIGRTRWFL